MRLRSARLALASVSSWPDSDNNEPFPKANPHAIERNAERNKESFDRPNADRVVVNKPWRWRGAATRATPRQRKPLSSRRRSRAPGTGHRRDWREWLSPRSFRPTHLIDNKAGNRILVRGCLYWRLIGGHAPPHMDAHKRNDCQTSYDQVADDYVRRIFDELQHKPLDRQLLERFAASVRVR